MSWLQGAFDLYQDVMSDVQVSRKCIILLLDEQKQISLLF